MKLSARMLRDVGGVNNFRPDPVGARLSSGDELTIYFQLIDTSLDTMVEGFSPAGRRYMPPATSTLTCTLLNLDDLKVVERVASQPYALDPSIWALDIMSTDEIDGTVSMRLLLEEPTRDVNGFVREALRMCD